MPGFLVVARFALGLVFLTSAGSKLRSPSTLVPAVQQYGAGFIGPKLALLIARLLPPVELLMGLLFLCGLWLTLVAWIAAGVLAMFTLAMAVNLAQGRRFRCNCFGSASSEIGIGSLSRNVLLLTTCLFLMVFSPLTFSVTEPLLAGLYLLSDPATIALALAGCSVYAALLVVGEIDSLFRISRKGV